MLNKLLRRATCKIKRHWWMPVTLSFYSREKDAWEYITEDAKHCRRCGKLVVPNSKLFQKQTSGDIWIREDGC